MIWFAWTIFLSWIGAGVIALLPRKWEAASRWLALVTALLAGLAAVVGTLHLHGTSPQTILRVPWIDALGVEFFLAADGVSAVLAILTGVASVAAILFSWNIETRPRAFFAFFLLLVGGVYGVFLSFDLFLLFVFYELAIIPKYFLIAIWGSTRKEYGAMKLVLYSFIGSAAVLAGMLILHKLGTEQGIAHPMDLTLLWERSLDARWQRILFPLFFVGFGILAGLWPLHSWAPTGHVAAPTGASMMLAGVVMKLGAYGAFRGAITLFPAGAMDWQGVVAVLAVIGIVYGAGVALVQRDFKFVIGYSSVSHMGVVLLGLIALNQKGWSGAVLQMFSHGLLAGILFAVVGRMVYDRVHTRDLEVLEQHRLGAILPFAAGTFFLGALASMGVPGFSGFIAELTVLIGAWHAFPWTVPVACLGILLGIGYLLRAYSKAFFGQEAGKEETWKKEKLGAITWPERLGAILLLGTSLFVGLWPRWIFALVDPVMKQLQIG